jgi:hypothetical protein
LGVETCMCGESVGGDIGWGMMTGGGGGGGVDRCVVGACVGECERVWVGRGEGGVLRVCGDGASLRVGGVQGHLRHSLARTHRCTAHAPTPSTPPHAQVQANLIWQRVPGGRSVCLAAWSLLMERRASGERCPLCVGRGAAAAAAAGQGAFVSAHAHADPVIASCTYASALPVGWGSMQETTDVQVGTYICVAVWLCV